MRVQPFTLTQRLLIRLQICRDLDLVRNGLVDLIARTKEGEKGYRALIQAHARGEKLRRELFHEWYAEPRADAPLLTEESHGHVS